VAMFIEPAGEPPALLRRQGLDGGFQLFHAHALNLRFPKPIANQNLPALMAQVLQKIFDERIGLFVQITIRYDLRILQPIFSP
jgi:hypothetical protein